jgi:hypothetical protein
MLLGLTSAFATSWSEIALDALRNILYFRVLCLVAFELDKSSKSNSRSSNKNNNKANKAEQGLVTVPVQAGYHVQYLFRLPCRRYL